MSITNLEGQILGGRYQIQALIGQGGMASVYKAYDPNLRRAVAIKVIHPHLSSNPEFFRRFEEEATAVAHLRHPNIVQMYDFNHEGDLYFMVMEYVVGETLQMRLKRLNASKRRMGIHEVVEYTADICDAADYAHQRGMIHRDIKPANIMLDVNGKAILMDFGIARMVGGTQHTATGAVLGTAMYMSPEAIRGLQTDGRADIYSLGITLYEMLSGKPPFEADSAMTLMMMHLNDPVPDLCELHPGVPVELVGVVEKSLAKNREARYATAREMGEALRKVPELVEKKAEVATPPVVKKAEVVAPLVVEATMVETAGVKDTGETVIEAAVPPIAVAKPVTPPVKQPEVPAKEVVRPVTPVVKQAEVPAQATLVEQVVKPSTQPTAPPVSVAPATAPVEKKRGKVWIAVVIVVLLLVIGGGGYIGITRLGGGGGLFQPALSATTDSAIVIPVASNTEVVLVATSTSQPSATETALPSPTSTEAPTVTPAPLVIGGADKIAFISGKNVWVANLDGSELTQLTQDGTEKNYLRWLPDGQGLTYISGKCIESVSLAGAVSQVTCFNNADKLEGFEVSPDGQQVAIGLDSQVYLVPFDLEKLSTAYSHDSLAALATCENMAPYTRNSARFVHWSDDSKTWAAVVQVPYNGMRADVVAVFAVDKCYPDNYAAFDIQFPPPHFTYPGYEKFPVIQDLGFDGNTLFTLHGITRNDGFGDLHLFNMETYKFTQSVNPINNSCCYRDAEFSPDGTYLVFAFQDINLGQESITKLYYIPYGTIGTGQTYTPLPLPDITDPIERPQPQLRPAIP